MLLVQYYVLINVLSVVQLVLKVNFKKKYFLENFSFVFFSSKHIQLNTVNQLVMITIDMFLHLMKKCFVCKHLDMMNQYLRYLANLVVLHPFIPMVGLIVIYKQMFVFFFFCFFLFFFFL